MVPVCGMMISAELDEQDLVFEASPGLLSAFTHL